MIEHFVSGTTKGEICHMCCDDFGMDTPASHKVGEEIASDEPGMSLFGPHGGGITIPDRHNFTAYVCCGHFRMIFGRAAFCPSPVTQ